MTKDKTSGPGPDTPAPARVSARMIEAVDVEIEAHLGHARLTVGALTALEPGATVPLDAPLNRAVELRLNGVTIAQGELVAVDDRFGVRLVDIVEWPE